MDEQTAGVGATVEGAAGIYHFQGSLLSSGRNEPQLQAFPQSGYVHGCFFKNLYDSRYYYSLGTLRP